MMTTAFYHLSNHALRIVFRIVLDLKVEGVENVPERGPVIIAINHTSFIDPLLVGAYVPRDVAMMSKIENFHLPVLGWIVRAYGAFPVQRGEVDRSALKKALEVLKGGVALLMAPEGTRSRDGQLQAAHDGMALLAARTGSAIVPFAIAGARPVSRNLKQLRRTAVRVKIGKPLFLPTGGAQHVSRNELRAVTDAVMRQLAELLPPEQRGIYSAHITLTPMEPRR